LIHLSNNFERILRRRNALLFAQLDSSLCKFQWILVSISTNSIPDMFVVLTERPPSIPPATPPAMSDTIGGVFGSYSKSLRQWRLC
jgi:hypothetical protein